ncbi:MAG: hypothetical protein A2189_00635 [Paenibacillus sp. RIFOXYA1_FULL_44_5]|nr:MAG: hypothetical protein A2189_00635 [Paenibacillus sp. RIFOXYA1_FULL_44_5]
MISALQSEQKYQGKKRKSADVYPFLQTYIAKRQQQISEIEQMIDRYEKKRLAEERAYQSMSSIRRMLSGKKPDHHLAVEYIHYVKKPLERIAELRKEMDTAQSILVKSRSEDQVELTDEIIKELE